MCTLRLYGSSFLFGLVLIPRFPNRCSRWCSTKLITSSCLTPDIVLAWRRTNPQIYSTTHNTLLSYFRYIRMGNRHRQGLELMASEDMTDGIIDRLLSVVIATQRRQPWRNVTVSWDHLKISKYVTRLLPFHHSDTPSPSNYIRARIHIQ